MKLMDICLQKKICMGGAGWRRLVNTKTVKVNGETIDDWNATVNVGDKIEIGKRIGFILE